MNESCCDGNMIIYCIYLVNIIYCFVADIICCFRSIENRLTSFDFLFVIVFFSRFVSQIDLFNLITCLYWMKSLLLFFCCVIFISISFAHQSTRPRNTTLISYVNTHSIRFAQNSFGIMQTKNKLNRDKSMSSVSIATPIDKVHHI